VVLIQVLPSKLSSLPSEVLCHGSLGCTMQRAKTGRTKPEVEDCPGRQKLN